MTLLLISMMFPTSSIEASKQEKRYISMTEFGKSNKEFIPKTLNLRTFNHVSARGIAYEGPVVILQQGLYHVVAVSRITHSYQGTPSMPGYAILMKETDSRTVRDKLLTGTIANTGFQSSSYVNGILDIKEDTRIALYHQLRVPKGKTVYLQRVGNGSLNHVFASLTIIEL